jgi:ribosomal peptide maturation radical SAM protein 1
MEEKELPVPLSPAEILIIIPPVVNVYDPSLPAHLMQACCQHIGIKTNVFYANLHFSNQIGIGLNNAISRFNAINFIGERLFCSSAFGLPQMGKNIHRLIDPDWLPDHLWQKKNKITNQKISEYFLAPIRKFLLKVDWHHVENQTVRWTESTAKQIARMGYRVVGCTNSHGGLVPAIALLNQVKLATPDIITVLGGALCEGVMAEGILSLNSGIDYVFSGESDQTFPTFVQKILAGKRPKNKIIYGQIVTNLDEIPVPDYQEYFRQVEYLGLPADSKIFIPYETSRGCRWKKCAFCSFNRRKHAYRTKSPHKIIKELGQISKQHPTLPIITTDTLMPQEYWGSLFPLITKALPSLRLRYAASAKLTLEKLITLKQKGFHLFLGIETLSSSLIKRMSKNATVHHDIAVLRYVYCTGISVWWNILYGIPGDQTGEYEEMLELFPLIHHLPPPERMIPIEILRFSQYQTKPGEFGISNLRPAELYKDVLPSHTDFEKIALYFACRFPSQAYENPNIITRLREKYLSWANSWKPDESNTKKSPGLKLHLERKPSGQFVLQDTRGLPGTREDMVVDKKKAAVLLVTRPWDNSPLLRWAVDAKLAVVRESWFIPLATAEPELLLEFEREYQQKNNSL